MLRLSLQQIESFYWVAKLSSFHGAARHQNLTQPTISVRVRELEDSLGEKLIERNQAEVRLTIAGEKIFPLVEKLLRIVDDIERGSNRRSRFDTLLRFGVVESIAIPGLSDLLSRIRSVNSETRVNIVLGVGSALKGQLISRSIDFALLAEPAMTAHVSDVFVGKSAWRWFAGSGFNVSGVLTPARLLTLNTITTGYPSIMYDVINNWCMLQGKEFVGGDVCNSIATIKNLVIENHGLSLLPIGLLREEIEAKKVVCFEADPPLPEQSYYLSYLKQHRVSITEYVPEIREMFKVTGIID